jgi:hypothetical protein
MRSIDSQFGLGFLLSLGALPIAGCPADDENDTNATTPSTVTNQTVGSTNTDTASDGTGGNPTSNTNATSDDTAGTNQTAGTDETGVATDTDPTGLDTGTGTGGLPEVCANAPIPPACTAAKDKYIECYPRYARYYETFEEYCACNIAYYAPMYGAGCGAAQEDYYACIGALSCEVLMGKVPYCEAEQMALETACFGGGTGTGTDDGGMTTSNET